MHPSKRNLARGGRRRPSPPGGLPWRPRAYYYYYVYVHHDLSYYLFTNSI